MKKAFTPYVEEILRNYRKTYQEFMHHTDDEMPSDETLLIVALTSDMDVMLKEMKKERMNNDDI